MKQWG